MSVGEFAGYTAEVPAVTTEDPAPLPAVRVGRWTRPGCSVVMLPADAVRAAVAPGEPA
jgi:hypothetical protein